MQLIRTFSSPPLTAHGGGYQPWGPAEVPNRPAPQPSPHHNSPDGFAGGVYASSNGLIKAEGRIAGAGGAIAASAYGLQAVMKAAGAAPIHLTGGLGAVGLLCAMTTVAAVGYVGWKGGAMVTDKALTGLDHLADRCSSKTASNLVKTLPRAALAVGVASLGSFGLNGTTLNLALPAAGVVAACGLGGAITG